VLPMRESTPLTVTNANKYFGAKLAFAEVNFRLRRGRILCIAGPNGGGKTTLLRCIVGIYSCDNPASVAYGLQGSTALERRRRIAYAPDDDSLIDELTGREYIEFVADTYNLDVAAARTRASIILHTLMFNESDLGILIRSYSHGMRKKLQLATTFMVEAPLALVDEPTNGLDPTTIILAKQIIQEARQHGAVIVSSHNLAFAQDIADEVLLLNTEPIAYGSLASVLKAAKTKQLETAYEELLMSRSHYAGMV
jgi:ABC-2 type transport system ATP-binding protein